MGSKLLPDYIRNKISGYLDKSDSNTAKLVLFFTNGHWLSITCGPSSCGGEYGLYEIMPSDKDIIGVESSGDIVLGWLTDKDVLYYIGKTAYWPI